MSRLGTVLVTGGCGFVGWHLVQHLLSSPDCDAVYILDRSIKNNRLEEATYIQGDVNDAQAVRALIAKVRPSVVFHTASPVASLPASRCGEYAETNIKGTQVLLEAAAASEDVKAFVYTSTIDVFVEPPHGYVDETHGLWSPTDTSNEYNRTKAIGDGLIREANGPNLATVSLRLAHAYGLRSSQGLDEIIDTCSGNQKLFQVGKGENLVEVVSAYNIASAHVLAAKALLNPALAGGKVDGEAFTISDGAPVPFWHHVRVIWAATRGEDKIAEKDVTVLPGWVMIAAVFIVKWLLWVVTFNMVHPPMALRRTSLEYCLYSHTYNIDKARKRLRFVPVVDHDAVLTESVHWQLEQRESRHKTA